MKTIKIPLRKIILENYYSPFLDPNHKERIKNYSPRKRSDVKEFIKKYGEEENKRWVKKYSPLFIKRMAIPSAIGAGIGSGIDYANEDNTILPNEDSSLDGALIGAGIGAVPGIGLNINSVRGRLKEHPRNLKKLYKGILKDHFY